jgi:hypothetical protein
MKNARPAASRLRKPTPAAVRRDIIALRDVRSTASANATTAATRKSDASMIPAPTLYHSKTAAAANARSVGSKHTHAPRWLHWICERNAVPMPQENPRRSAALIAMRIDGPSSILTT